MEAYTDAFEDLGFGLVGEGGMVLNLVDGSEAQVGRGDCFLDNGRQLNDWDIESSGSDFQHFEGRSLLLGHW